MNKAAIAERLKALANDNANRSKAARLRDVYHDVETALAAGVPRTLIVETLAANGIEMTLATFETTLKRIRKKLREQPLSVPARQTSGQTRKTNTSPIIEETETEGGNQNGSHNPADLDAIISSKPDLAALAKLGKKDKKR
jgi:hypothetical protein